MTKVAVLYGGLSSEREVSLVSGKACAKALQDEGFDVQLIDMTKNLLAQLQDAQPDVIFNALHGDWGEDGRAQAVLDLYGKPYSHSGVMASALAMDKHRTKAVLRDSGIGVPKGKLVKRVDAAKVHSLTPPYVLKPNGQGSSVGVLIVKEGDRVPAHIADHEDMGEWIIAEEFVDGRELTVTVMGGEALAVTEIIPAEGFYDYEAKYADGGSSHVVPAELPKDIYQLCLHWSEKAYATLGCRGIARADLIFSEESAKNLEDVNAPLTEIVNKVVMLEVNTQPGMTPTSLAPEQAAFKGIDFKRLCRWIVEDATWPR